MTPNRLLCLGSCATLMFMTGCTSLREVPRSEYALVPERQHVRLLTEEGLEYEFDFARFGADSLVGFRRYDQEGVVETFASLRIPYEHVRMLSLRRVDWTRTGLVGGGMLAAVVAAGLSTSSRDEPAPESPGGGPRLP